MNFVYISPHFPPNYAHFCRHLSYLGVNVLGLADERYDFLAPELRSALTEYYRVNDMHNYDEVLRALGYFTHRHGKIDRIDSHNEYWLEMEAQLRTDFNIFGMKNQDILKAKKKSLMKQVFTQAGVPVARGRVVHTLKDAKKFIKETGYPVVAKPDIGVGAAKTYKIENAAQLEDFFATKPDLEYILEEFVSGIIQTFDGLVDRDGNLVFYTSHQYSQGIMEAVNQDDLIFYYSLREIPQDLEDAGRRVLKAYDLRERFFHFEFFRTEPGNQIVALEVNMRPPGGFTTDMFNYANDIDIYKEWAHVVVFNKFTAEYNRKYHSCYVCRKYNRQYRYSHDDILREFGECCITHHDSISGVFSAALGDYGYLIRSPELDDIFAMAAYIHELA
ncbi:MAG: ATP-dependent carboxylate-amine ligase [Chloroflexi bacterium]|nr:ATP-dependent carboxylate-amine ligase [Chloroflexota bacterium]